MQRRSIRERSNGTVDLEETTNGFARKETARMTPRRMEEFFAAWNAHDVERIAGFFTSDGAYLASIGPDDDGTPFRGIDEVRRGVAGYLSTYPDARYTDTRFLIAANRGLAEWTFRGTTVDGKRVVYRGVDVFEFVGDRVRLKDAFRKERSAPVGT
jgi:ketosteroid isomerase-like protein